MTGVGPDVPPPPPYPPPPPWPGHPPPGAPAGPYAGAPGYAPYPARGTNGFAIASLVCSIVACGIGSVLAIVFGHVARRQIKRTHEGGGGLAIAGLVVGYLGLVGIVAFIGVFVFAYDDGAQYARDDARRFEQRVVAYARLTGTTPRDPRAIDRALTRDCCSDATIGVTGIPARGASTFELARAGWHIQFDFVGEPGSGRVCLTVPAGTTTRGTDIRDGRCRAPDTVGRGV